MYGDAWDDMSSKYDQSVEANQDPVISGYLSEETRIVGDICKRLISLDSGKKYTIVDMGSGTGRVIFSLCSQIGDSASYVGLDSSKPMVELSQKKFQENGMADNGYDVSFLHHDVTDPNVSSLFDDDSVKIMMCMYNTIGVIPIEKRQDFFDSMGELAGENGVVLISAFNGDDFAFVAPKIYAPMKGMVKKIDDDSFDEKKLAFRNSLGYYSQWFKKSQVSDLLHSDVAPISIDISYNGQTSTFGNVFSNRNI